MRLDSYDVLGVPVSAVTPLMACRLIGEWARDSVSRMVLIRDVHGIMLAQKSPELMRLHRDAAMVTPDGMPLVWLGKLAKQPVERTCGPDLMDLVMAESGNLRVTHFLYGGKDGVAERLKAVFEKKYPEVRVVDYETPPFRALTENEIKDIAQRINVSGADIVWIGVSTPKQEYLMRDLLPLTHATLIGVGAAYDFHLGTISRAPKWMQKVGFEWLWRLMCEPKRLWRRYLIIAPSFVWQVLSAKVYGNVRKTAGVAELK